VNNKAVKGKKSKENWIFALPVDTNHTIVQLAHQQISTSANQ